jgi:hypothetical protein
MVCVSIYCNKPCVKRVLSYSEAFIIAYTSAFETAPFEAAFKLPNS